MRLFHENRKGKCYLKEQLFLHHLFGLADETLLQGVNFLYQLIGSGVTGLFKGTKQKSLRHGQLRSLCKRITDLLKSTTYLQTQFREMGM